MKMRVFGLIFLTFTVAMQGLIAANPAIIWGSGGYALNLAGSGIELKSGAQIDDVSSTVVGVPGLQVSGTTATVNDNPIFHRGNFSGSGVQNLLPEANVETITPSNTSCSSVGDVCVYGTIARTTQIKPFDKRVGSIDSLINPDDVEFTLTYANSDYEGVQMLMGATVKAPINTANGKITAKVDGEVQWSADLPADGKEREYYYPVVGGATNYELVISADTVAGAIEYDHLFLGRTPPGYIQQVGQAHFVGGLTYAETDCLWDTTSASFADMPTDSDCTASSVKGGVSEPSTKIPAVKILNVRTDGYYKVESNGLLYANPDTECRFSLSSSGTYEGNPAVWVKQDVSGGNSLGGNENQISGTFKFDSSGDKEIRIIGYRAAGSNTCRIFGRDTSNLQRDFTVHFYPDSNETVVQQSNELTAETANSFTALIEDNGSVNGDSYDFIDGDCVLTDTSLYTCQLNDLGITELMSCSVSESYTNRQVAYITSSSSTSQIVFRSTTNNAVTNATSRFSIDCSKHDDDYNKSQTIVGKFEQIKSSETPVVRGAGNGGESITAAVTNIPFTEVEDTAGAWDGSVFTAPSDGYYTATGTVYFSTSLQRYAFAYIDTGSGFNDKLLIDGGESSPSSDYQHFSGILKLNQGDKIAIRVTGNGGTLLNNPENHHIHIQRIPDTESIVKNLNDKRNVECQTKIASANFGTGSGTLNEISFSGLQVGRRYIVRGQLNSSDGARLRIEHDSSSLGFHENASGGFLIVPIVSRIFTASSTTVNFNKTDTTSTFFGNGTFDLTWTQLCELPDNYVTTEKF